MIKTKLAEIHEKHGGKMVNYSGYYMPVQYSGIKEEHCVVRTGVGVFDVSHMGEFEVKGGKSKAFLQRMSSNDLNKISPGQAQYTVLPNGLGGIVDDLLIYMLDEDHYWLVVNAANIEKDFDWLFGHLIEETELVNISDQVSQLAIQGPKSKKVVETLTTRNLNLLKPFTFIKCKFAGIEDIILSRTGYTGEDGFEVYFPNKHAEHMWNKIMEAGKDFDISPIGLGARDTLRLEAGLCLYGNDIDTSTSPLEAGLGWITSFDKELDFIDKHHLLGQKSAGLKRHLIGFEMIDKGIPRIGYDIENSKGEKIGNVTSGTISPTLEKGIGMGYININYYEPGKIIYIKIRNKYVKAKVVKRPFYKTSNTYKNV